MPQFIAGDPIDNRYIELKVSEKYPEAGEGAHARKPVLAKTIYSVYGGRIFDKESFKEFNSKTLEEFMERELKLSDQDVINFWKYR